MVRCVLLSIAVLHFFLLSGCGSAKPHFERIRPLPDISSCRIAVLPLINNSGFANGEKILYKVLYAELAQSKNMSLIQEGEVADLYQQLKIYPSQEPTLDQLNVMGERLDAQFFISGDIIQMVEREQVTHVQTNLAIILRLYEAKTGKLLWTTYHRGDGEDYRIVFHFARVNTITGLAQQVVSDVIELWFRQGLHTCSN